MDLGRVLSSPGELGRAALLCLAPLGLTWLLARVPTARPTVPFVAVQFSVFAAASMLVTRGIASPIGPERRRAGRFLHAVCMVVVLAASSTLIAWLPWRWSIRVLTLFGAAVEEFVFRRELPGALTRVLRPGAGRWAGAVSVSLAQVVFATCHFVATDWSGAYPAGQTFLWLAAAGVCLAGLYRASGTLAIPLVVHFGFNWSALHAA